MIGIITSPRWNFSSIFAYMEQYAPELRLKVHSLDWGALARVPELARPFHTVIFIAQDAFAYKQLVEIERSLLEQGKRVLNRPSVMRHRFDLLTELYCTGINSFLPHDADSDMSQWKFPVYFRAREDQATVPALIPDAATAREAVRLQPHLVDPGNMVVEYVETRTTDGVFRKYGFMRISDRYIPRHVLFSKSWFLKYPDLVDKHLVNEEMAFITNAKPPQEIRDAFAIANIEYGRVDYSYDVEGRLQIWEINHNPHLTTTNDTHPSRHAGNAHAAKAICQAFKEML